MGENDAQQSTPDHYSVSTSTPQESNLHSTSIFTPLPTYKTLTLNIHPQLLRLPPTRPRMLPRALLRRLPQHKRHPLPLLQLKLTPHARAQPPLLLPQIQLAQRDGRRGDVVERGLGYVSGLIK